MGDTFEYRPDFPARQPEGYSHRVLAAVSEEAISAVRDSSHLAARLTLEEAP
jgi:hypothetical protein